MNVKDATKWQILSAAGILVALYGIGQVSMSAMCIIGGVCIAAYAELRLWSLGSRNDR